MTNGQSINGKLVYSKIGNGDEILFAFHGFGQNRSFFEGWEKKLGLKFTIYAFDLFYHGESTREYKKLSKEEWKAYVSEIIEKEKITQFSLLGYSLGGRFAITTALSFPALTKEIILIAPDGIFLTIWFKLATTPIIKLLFKYMMMNPDKLEKWVRFNQKVKIVNR